MVAPSVNSASHVCDSLVVLRFTSTSSRRLTTGKAIVFFIDLPHNNGLVFGSLHWQNRFQLTIYTGHYRALSKSVCS